jgi:hypothetical protein
MGPFGKRNCLDQKRLPERREGRKLLNLRSRDLSLGGSKRIGRGVATMRSAGLKFLLCCLIVFTFSAVVYTQDTSDAAPSLDGKFIWGHQFGGSSISFKSDGSYTIEDRDCTSEDHRSGRYNFKSGIVTLTQMTWTTGGHNGGPGFNMLDPKIYRERFKSEMPSDVSKGGDLLAVKWGDRLYLIPTDGIQMFCNAINLGLEPRPWIISEPFYGIFYLREGDEVKRVTGRPNLPEKWKDSILDKPVTAEVLLVEDGHFDPVVIINKGSLSGLKVGMSLVSVTKEPWPFGDPTVISLTEYTAKLKGGRDLSPGDRLSTRYTPSHAMP